MVFSITLPQQNQMHGCMCRNHGPDEKEWKWHTPQKSRWGDQGEHGWTLCVSHKNDNSKFACVPLVWFWGVVWRSPYLIRRPQTIDFAFDKPLILFPKAAWEVRRKLRGPYIGPSNPVVITREWCGPHFSNFWFDFSKLGRSKTSRFYLPRYLSRHGVRPKSL